MFAVLGIILSLFALLEVSNRIKYNSKAYYFFAILLLVMLCFRYGQGTDYHAYELQYEYINRAGRLLVNTLYHGELGWYVLMFVSKRIGLSFSLFIGVLSLLMMLSTIKAINKYSPYKIFSLLLLYPTFYLTYFYSAVRQGLVLSLFLCFGLEWLLNKKYLRYCILMIILALFHSSAIVLLVLPIALHFRDRRPGKWVLFAFLFMIVVGYTGVLNGIGNRMGRGSYFSVSISVMAIVLRSILFCIIYSLFKATDTDIDSKWELERTLYYIYVVGFLLYIMFAFSGVLSQRMTMPMKGIEVILIPMLVAKLYKCRSEGRLIGSRKFMFLRIGQSSVLLVVLIVILALDVEMIKNINSYLVQGNYYDWVNVFNYPYVSVFNKEDIFKYISHFD